MINGSHSFAYPAPHFVRPAAELVIAPAPVLIVSFGSMIFYPLFFHPFNSSAPSPFSSLVFVCAAAAECGSGSQRSAAPLAKEGMVAVTFKHRLNYTSLSHAHHTCGQTVNKMKTRGRREEYDQYQI